MKALIRVTPVTSPSEKFRGLKFQATAPNKAGKKFIPVRDGKTGDTKFLPTSQVIPSFQKPYLIRETFGGCSVLTRADYDRFCELLRWEGFTEFEPYGERCKETLNKVG